MTQHGHLSELVQEAEGVVGGEGVKELVLVEF